ncbi:MAG: ACT domain-containing protein [Nitrosopumilus sp.]|nr:ACT domain-containing protein [Nitrosopumilus sp.]CAI9830826.1 conserved hypothetical protein [Nitrosopumilaceae archaeon]MDA7941081.1 ACT domain-containing protein [Nitrosopumilus sp.]MDA7942521.1 ACT domain-containing protein [Nitrosopumilus sp.]MDA7944520.1 ACT domain-containing protein [Nitrosopumilus sp.]
MRNPAISVPEIVRELVTRNRSIYDCMKMDVINYTALAVKLHPEVERIQGNPVNLNTVVVAIKRYADSFERKDGIGAEPVLKNARLFVTDGIMDVRLSAKDGGVDPMAVLDGFTRVTDDCEFFRLSDSFRFLVEDMEDVRRIFRDAHGRDEMFSTGLAKIRIALPPAHSRSDAVSYVAEVLHANGIEIANAFFGSDGITIIVDGKDSGRAYDILRSGIARG